MQDARTCATMVAMFSLSVRTQEWLIRAGIFLLFVGIVGGLFWLVRQSVQEKQTQEALVTALSRATTALEVLGRDTGEQPGHIPLKPCLADEEVSLDDCRAGLVCTDGRFPFWQGPYLPAAPRDPWGSVLRFDPDYACLPDIAGCGGEWWVRAIVAAGPDKQFDTKDDIVAVLCRE